jgi:hypothetical protein
VEKLSMIGAKPVDILLMKIIPRPRSPGERAIAALWTPLRDPLRLIACVASVESTPLCILTRKNNHVNVHRYEETIGGRAYQIEVTPVSNRWRAQLRRTAGMPTAMMPFYGQTPDEAAHQLAQWLALAHRRQQQT